MNTDKLKQYLDELSDGTDFSFEISEATDETIELYMQGDNPCCEDWCIEFTIDNPTTKKELTKILANKILELYEIFDVEEETYLMLEAKRNGFSGVPDVVDLVHNEEYKENALKEFAEKLQNLYNNLGKEETDTMNKQQFFEYIQENFNIDGASQRLILNILDYVEANYSEENEQYNALVSLLDGTIGLEDAELKKVHMQIGVIIMELHLYYLDRKWTKRGDCAHNYNLVVDLDNKTYKIYVSPFYEYERSSDIEVKRKSDIMDYIEYLKENGFVDTDEIYCG